MKCVVVTNIPAPYRNPVWARLPRTNYTVVFCARSEGNREWQLLPPDCDHVFLQEKTRALSDGYNFVHDNRDVWEVLNRLSPDVVVTTGLNPTHLYAILWARLHRAGHVYMTDGTELSERDLGWKHRLLRSFIVGTSAAGVAASLSGQRLLESYGLSADRIYLNRLCADNARFAPLPFAERLYDVMFCGQLHERKLPYFFASVCAEILRRRGTCRTLIVGDGPERGGVFSALREAGIEPTWPGFVQPEELPGWYQQARLLLFSTRRDAWGVIANEAMGSGTPVITTPEAGCAGDLVRDGINGRVLPADVATWAHACVELLDDEVRWQALSDRALQDVQEFNFDDAAQGLQMACEAAARSRRRR